MPMRLDVFNHLFLQNLTIVVLLYFFLDVQKSIFLPKISDIKSAMDHCFKPPAMKIAFCKSDDLRLSL
jgi:hypothetical protein